MSLTRPPARSNCNDAIDVASFSSEFGNPRFLSEETSESTPTSGRAALFSWLVDPTRTTKIYLLHETGGQD